MITAESLKASTDLRTLVQETHQLTKTSKINCLWHDDKNPSLHIFQDGYFCFSCGAFGDHFDWLKQVRKLSFAEALDYLSSKPLSNPQPLIKRATFQARNLGRNSQPLPEKIAAWHLHRASQLSQLPEALSKHGFTFKDCKQLNIASEGKNAIIPIFGIEGELLALKRRYSSNQSQRYDYIIAGRGTPAWCSPEISKANSVLIVEGELNAMMCWLVLKEKTYIGVIGVAGTNSSYPERIVKNKVIFIYTDNDEAGIQAQARWASKAYQDRAKAVYQLESWSMDACALVNRFGKAYLRKKLLWGKKQLVKNNFDAEQSLAAKPVAVKDVQLESPKPDLMQSCIINQKPTILCTEKPQLSPQHTFNLLQNDAA